MLYIIINTGQKIQGTILLPTRPGGEIGENFLLAKISGYMVDIYCYTCKPCYYTDYVYKCIYKKFSNDID